jgi:hypothetical protein
MPDTPTTLADVFVPEIFNSYAIEASTKFNAFFQSGIVADVPDLNFGQRGGLKINMPYWKQPDEDAQLLDEEDDLVIKKIEAGKDEAVQHARALVFGATDLSGAFAGSDPMAVIGNMAAQNWSNVMTRQLLASLKGALGALAAEVSPINYLDISDLSGGAAVIDGHSFVDACQTLGDAKVKIVGVGMHSAVESDLLKNDLIETIRDSEGKEVMKVFQGRRVFVDDQIEPVSGDIYTTVLFGQGSIGYGEGAPKRPSAIDRNELKSGGEEFLVSRRHYVLHPRGIKWNPQSGVPAKTTPSDAELANPANWQRCYEPKNIRLVLFRHKIS